MNNEERILQMLEQLTVDVAEIKPLLKATFDQVAALTEANTQISRDVQLIRNEQESLSDQVAEHEYAIRFLKRRVGNA